MGKFDSFMEVIDKKLQLSRRGFVKGAIAVGATASLYGCSKGDGAGDFLFGGGGVTNAIPEEDLSKPEIYWAQCVHNCGAGERCASKVHMVNGRVVRVTSDDSERDYNGDLRDKEQWNDSRALTCPKGRAFKYKLYHPGKLKYALKQTKQRGDVTGFIRISTEQAMKEIAQKYRNVYDKYGSGAIYNTYGTSSGYGGKFANCSDARNALTTFYGGVRGGYSDYSFHQYNYAWPLTGHPGILYTYGADARISNYFADIADQVKTIISWGSNTLSTNNTTAYPYIRSVEKLKARGGKVYHISPEFVDTGVTLATDWVQIRNYTDTALVMSMLYEMLINTFNEDGSIKPDPWLDVNYLDTMVYGFFDSPAYWVMTTKTDADAGKISLTAQTGAGWVKIDEVPAGMSLSAYVMGDDTRLQRSKYADGKNYTAQQFAPNMAFRNMSGCSLTIKGKPAHACSAGEINASKYLYKKDLMKSKTPEWAEKICGTPATTIRELAKLYCTPSAHPIFSEWCGGLQKQDNGVVNIFAIGALMCVTKTFGLNAEGLYGSWKATTPKTGTAEPGGLKADGSTPSQGTRPTLVPGKEADVVPSISCKEWHNAIKIGFHDVLKANGYKGDRLPEWNKDDRYIYDDAGTKTGVKWLRNVDKSIKVYTDTDGKEYYDYEGRTTGKPTFVGTRMIIQIGGGIQLNQHFNTNDNAEMYRCLPIGTDSSNPDTFCLVQFDIFLSPTSRFADYVLPAVTSLEAGDWQTIGGQTIYRPPLVKPLGDAKDGWRLAFEAYKAQAELGGKNILNKDIPIDAHWKYVGSANNKYQSAEVLSMAIIDTAINLIGGRFYGMTRTQVYGAQYSYRKNDPEPKASPTVSPLRANLNTYLELSDSARMATPFVYKGDNTEAKASADASGIGATDIADPTGRPNFAGRMQVYNNTAVWDYEHKYSKYHGWLPLDKRGQSNADYEGDKNIIPIPIYWNFEDCFAESYGAFKSGKQLSEIVPNGLTLGTTHDRYRVHSTNAENPLLRELNHRTKGGKLYSANDWNSYAVMPARHLEGSTAPISPMLSSSVYKKDMTSASWQEIWINTQDATERGIADGDLIRVENPIGAVRVIARLTDRCVRGHVNLHQGGWYDPNPKDGVDDGGCANTLMSCKPSRYDNGNSQQMAYVTVRKETEF